MKFLLPLLCLSALAAHRHDATPASSPTPCRGAPFAAESVAAESVAKSHGCTALGRVSGDIVYWDGCPSNACGTGQACQLSMVGNVWQCECTGDHALSPCIGQAEMADPDEGIVGSWDCLRAGCPQACTKNAPPPSGPFRFCDC